MKIEHITLFGASASLIYLLNSKKAGSEKVVDKIINETVIYDLGKKYPETSYGYNAWEYKNLWIKLPVGFTGVVNNDVTIRTKMFHLYLNSSPANSVFTFPDYPDNFLKGEEMYSIYMPTPQGYSVYGGTSEKREIIINTNLQKTIRSISWPITKPDGIWTVGMEYTFFKNYNWMKMKGYGNPSGSIVAPNDQGCHGETRFIVLPDFPRDRVDKVYDSKYYTQQPQYYVIYIEPAKMILNFYIASDSLVIFTYDTPTALRSEIDYDRNAWGGGWSYTGEEAYGADTGNTVGIFAVMHTLLPCFYTILKGDWNHTYWNYMWVKQSFNAGDTIKNFRVVYERSPIYNQPWKPSIMGIWRINARVGDDVFTQEVDVKKPDDLFFLIPRTDFLEYILCYIYDRNELTPTYFTTPMDFYRETRGK